jgi:hypothetical protein
MAASALFSAHPEYRALVRWFEEDGLVYVESRQDVEPIIKAAQERAEWPAGKEFRHTAYMPMEIYGQACREGWINDRARVRRWLNDSANACFRTWKGVA